MRKKNEECGCRLELVDWTHLAHYLGLILKLMVVFEKGLISIQEDVDWY